MRRKRSDQPLFREPDGAAKKAKLASWFKAVAPDIEVGVCPAEKSGTDDEFPGMDVRIIQKSMEIPSRGFVVNVELTRHDYYENDGIFSKGDVAEMRADWERYKAAPNAASSFTPHTSRGSPTGATRPPTPSGAATARARRTAGCVSSMTGSATTWDAGNIRTTCR